MHTQYGDRENTSPMLCVCHPSMYGPFMSLKYLMMIRVQKGRSWQEPGFEFVATRCVKFVSITKPPRHESSVAEALLSMQGGLGFNPQL